MILASRGSRGVCSIQAMGQKGMNQSSQIAQLAQHILASRGSRGVCSIQAMGQGHEPVQLDSIVSISQSAETVRQHSYQPHEAAEGFVLYKLWGRDMNQSSQIAQLAQHILASRGSRGVCSIQAMGQGHEPVQLDSIVSISVRFTLDQKMRWRAFSCSRLAQILQICKICARRLHEKARHLIFWSNVKRTDMLTMLSNQTGSCPYPIACIEQTPRLPREASICYANYAI